MNHDRPGAGAEQAGDTRLPAVFFSKSLKATLASLELTGAPGASPIHKHNGEQVQTLLAEGATEHNRVSQRNLPPTPGHQQTGSMLWGQTGETGGKADVVNHGGKQKEASLASCAAAEKSNSQAAPVGAADVDGSCYVKRGMADAVKLLAHTDGGVPVRQAVLNHFSQGTAEAASTCRSNLTGVKDATLQLPRSELSAAAAVTTDMTTDVTTDMTTDVTTDNSAKIGPIAILAVGPEGGCTPSEVALLTEELAFQNVTTAGGRTLDTTTAVISLVTLVGEAMMSCYSHDNSRFLRGSKVSIY